MPHAQGRESVQLRRRLWRKGHVGRSVPPGGDGFDFGFERSIQVVQPVHRLFRRLGSVHHGPCQVGSTGASFRPRVGDGKTDAQFFAGRLHQRVVRRVVLGKGVQRHHHGKPQRQQVFRVFFQIGQAGLQVAAAVVVQSAYGGHNDGHFGPKSGGAGLDVHKLFCAQIRAKSCFCNHPVCVAQGHSGGQQGIGALRNVGKRAAVQNSRVAFQGLHQIRADGVLHQQRHGLFGVEHGGEYRFPVPRVAHVNPAHAGFQVFQALALAQNRHNFRRRRNVEAPFPRNAPVFATQSDHDLAQGAVVHVHDPLPGNGAGVQPQRPLLGLQVVVDQGGQEVVGFLDGREVARKMEVDVFHGDHLGMTAAGGSAFDSEHRTQGRFPQGRCASQADVGQSVREAYADRGLAFSRRGGGNGRNQHQVRVFFAIGAKQLQGKFGLGAAVKFQSVCGEAYSTGNVNQGARRDAACNFQIRHGSKVGYE